MSDATVIYWRDIPTQVVIGSGRKAAKWALPNRFLVAVDKAAMAGGVTDTDDYLAQWAKRPAEAPDLPPQEAAEALAQRIEDDYPASRLAALARQGGLEQSEQEQS